MHNVQHHPEKQNREQHLISVRRPSAVSDVDETADSAEPSMDSLQSLVVMLEVFDKCNRGTDDMICKEDLENELSELFGRGEDANSALRSLIEAMHSNSDTCRFDFLSYWHGMDYIFLNLGCCPHPVVPHPSGEDAVQGMQRLRDGVLEVCKQSSTHEVSVTCLHDIVAKIRTESREPQQWDERFLEDLCSGESDAVSRLGISRVLYKRLRDHLVRWQTKIGKNGTPGPLPEQEANWRSGAVLMSPKSRHRTGACPDSSGFVSEDLQPAHELVEALRGVIKQEHVAAHDAIEQLWALYESLIGRLHRREADFEMLRRSSQECAAKRKKLEQDLRYVREAFESEGQEQLDLNERVQEQQRRIQWLERELRQVKEECESSHSEHRTQLKSAERECERLHSRYVQLQHATENAESRSHDVEFQEQAERLACLEAELGKLGPLQDDNSMLRRRLAKLEELLSTEQQQHQDALKELSAARQHAQEALFQAAVVSSQKGLMHIDEHNPLEDETTIDTNSVVSSSFLTDTSSHWGDEWFTTSRSSLKKSPKKKMRVQLARPVKKLA